MTPRNRSFLAHLCAGAMARRLSVEIDGVEGQISRMFVDGDRRRWVGKQPVNRRDGFSWVGLEIGDKTVGLDSVDVFEREDGAVW